VTLDETLFRVQKVFRDVFDDPSLRIDEHTTMTDLPDWDSVITIQLVLGAEAEFGIRFKTDEVAGVKSVRDILDVVRAHYSKE